MFSENTLSGNTYDFGKYESTRFENTQSGIWQYLQLAFTQ